jgi:molecular chaperone DnaK (HSP70)
LIIKNLLLKVIGGDSHLDGQDFDNEYCREEFNDNNDVDTSSNQNL